MGYPMAANLLKHGWPVVVSNRSPARALQLGNRGASVAVSPEDTARKTDVLITMLSDDAAVRNVYFGDKGILSGIEQGHIVIDCSTVSPELSRELHRELAALGAAFLDAPVTGSKPAAEAGRLFFMVGGDEDVLREVDNLLLSMGTGYRHMGGPGSGTLAKLANNAIGGITLAALAEGMAIAAKAGIDLEAFRDVVMNGGARSRMAELKMERILDRQFDPQFSLSLMLKDLQLAQALTASQQLSTPLLHSAENIYRLAVREGLGERDMAAVAQLYEHWAGTEMVRHSLAEDKDGAGAAFGQERRRSRRIPLEIRLQISIYQWEKEGAFSGQSREAILQDLSGSGLQLICDFPLSLDMFVVIHFPLEADLPPVTAKIIRVEKEDDTFRYGCLITGMALHTKTKLESYIERQARERSRA